MYRHRSIRLGRSTRSRTGFGLALVLGFLTCARPVQAEAVSEFWPELGVFVALNPQARLFLNLPYARNRDSGDSTLDIAAYLDPSLLPLLRPSLRSLDWQRSRFLWARVGLDRIVQTQDDARAVTENRGILSILAKAELPEEVWLEGRGWIRVDPTSAVAPARTGSLQRLQAPQPQGP